MPQKVTTKDCLAEIERFFRYYFNFCKSPLPDSVREVLASIYSVNDKVRKAGYPNFFNNDEFLAIKAIRNYAIHQAEIYNETRALPLISSVPIEADLNILCLLPKSVIEKILENTNQEAISAIKQTCVFYTKYVDIYPSIFNFGVKLFLYTEENSLEIDSKEFLGFKNSIEYERVNGYPHFVTGGVKLLNGGDIDQFLDNSLQSIEQISNTLNTLYSKEKSIYTFKGF